MNYKSLWPDLRNLPLVKTPKVLLIEQTIMLESITHQSIRAEVISFGSPTSNSKIIHQLKIWVPSLENFTMIFLQVEHEIIKFYPATINSKVKPLPVLCIANNEIELAEFLKSILNDKESVETLEGLLIQSKALDNIEKELQLS